MPQLVTGSAWQAIFTEAVRAVLVDVEPKESRQPRPDSKPSPSEARIRAFGLALLAGATASISPTKCNDGSSVADCDYYLRPGDTPYYRCHHTPPHCYSSDGSSMSSCP